jgi:hypothetical protein
MAYNGQIKLQNLNYGNYTIKIKNNSSSQTDAKIKERKVYINVLPPWYLSIWIKFLYLLIVSDENSVFKYSLTKVNVFPEPAEAL